MSDEPDVDPGSGAVALDDPPDPSAPPTAEAEAGEEVEVGMDDDGSAGAGGPTDADGEPAEPGVPLAIELARVTGLLLVALLPVHLVTVLLADPTDVDALLERWDNRWWLLADWGFLTVGVAHCLLSLRARVLALGGAGAEAPNCPHCGGELPADDDGFGRTAYLLLVTVTIALYLAASWAMLRLV